MIKGIKQLADDEVKFNLAISLLTADNEKRNNIMPVNRTNPLDELAKAIQYFHKKTGTRVTFEYLMLRDFNDSLSDAKKLAEFCRIVPCKVNLIEFNTTGDEYFKKSLKSKTEAFFNFLEKHISGNRVFLTLADFPRNFRKPAPGPTGGAPGARGPRFRLSSCGPGSA